MILNTWRYDLMVFCLKDLAAFVLFLPELQQF